MHKNEKRNRQERREDRIVYSLYGMAFVVGIVLVIFIWNYRKAETTYDNLAAQYVVMNTGKTASADNQTNATQSLGDSSPKDNVSIEADWYSYARVDIGALKALNPDIIGWILFENEDTSLPILYSGDNDTYLRRSYDGKQDATGSIFMDQGNQPDFSDLHTILYGHNMRNLTMFGKLKKYIREPLYYEDHRYFQIFTESEILRYEIFSYKTVNRESGQFTVDFSSEEDYNNFLAIVNKNTREETVKADATDQILTLATCSTSGEDNRFLVHARLVDEVFIDELPEK